MILRSEPRKISYWSDLLGQTMVQIKAPLRQMNSATIVFDVLFFLAPMNILHCELMHAEYLVKKGQEISRF